jgi:hypothetical protein
VENSALLTDTLFKGPAFFDFWTTTQKKTQMGDKLLTGFGNSSPFTKETVV